MPYCSECGADCPSGSNLCPKCGAEARSDGEDSTQEMLDEFTLDQIVTVHEYEAPAPASVVCPFTGMKFVEVPGGVFKMGDLWGDGGENEKPVHQVSLNGFRLAKTPVTQKQWAKVMGNKAPWHWKGGDYPAHEITWEQAHEFILQLNFKTGRTYRLPTEAEWEYAARSRGKEDEKWAGAWADIQAPAHAWFNKGSLDELRPVGRKKANGLGLYDMSGNIMEWVEDRYGEYAPSNQTNPTGPLEGHHRVCRGGNNPWTARTSWRTRCFQGYRMGWAGFRLALSR